MDLTIRLETPADHREAEEVTREAFWNHYSPGCNEHYLLHIMRGTASFVPELDLVAVTQDKIAGVSVCLTSYIDGDDGLRREVLSLGPIAVRPDLQRLGIGKRLIEHTRQAAAAAGYHAILLCGDPAYYGKVGFVPAERYGIRTAEDKYFAALHACPLYPGALDGAAGKYHEDAIYVVDAVEAREFDATFPHRERISGTPSQLRFIEVAAMQRKHERP